MDINATASREGVGFTSNAHQPATTQENGDRHLQTVGQQGASKHASPPRVHASHSPSAPLPAPQQPQDWSERAGSALRRVASTLSRGAAGDCDASVRSASTRRGWLGGSRHGAAGVDASAHGGDLSVHSGKSLRRAQSVYNVDGELEGTVHTQRSMPLTSSSRGASRRDALASPGQGVDSTHLGGTDAGATASASRNVPLFGRVLPAPSAASLEDADLKHMGAGVADGDSGGGVELPSLGPGLVVREVSATGHIHIISVQPADKKSGDWLMHAHTLRSWLCNYFRKWKGGKDTPLARDSWLDLAFSWIGAFCGILLVSALHKFLSPKVDTPLMIASFGASAVLLFGVPNSKMAQPRNCIGGHMLSAVTGIITRIALQDVVWVSAPLGMSLSLTVMQLTGTTHPPGGATALIAASAPYIGDWEGFKFLLTVFFGSVALIIVALITNNASPTRSYPTFWY